MWVSACVCVCVCVGGDPTLPLTICCFDWEKKSETKTECVCKSVSKCVAFRLSHLQLALSWQASPLPHSLHNGAQREPAICLSLPPLALLCLGFVNRSLLMWPPVLPRNSPLLQPSLAVSVLQSVGRNEAEWARHWRIGRLQACWCVCVCVRTPLCMYMWEGEERHLQQSQGRPAICAWLMSWQPKQSHLCEREVRKRRNYASLCTISSLHTFTDCKLSCIISASLKLPKALVRHSRNTILLVHPWSPSQGVAPCSFSTTPCGALQSAGTLCSFCVQTLCYFCHISIPHSVYAAAAHHGHCWLFGFSYVSKQLIVCW